MSQNSYVRADSCDRGGGEPMVPALEPLSSGRTGGSSVKYLKRFSNSSRLILPMSASRDVDFTSAKSDASSRTMYFRATFVPGWPKGYEAQVENTSGDPQKTGSLYNIKKIFEQKVQDDTWWNEHIIANGKHIQIFVNGEKLVDTEDGSYTKGYLALQQHNKGSVVEYKNLYMRILPAGK